MWRGLRLMLLVIFNSLSVFESEIQKRRGKEENKYLQSIIDCVDQDVPFRAILRIF